jgi:hypothetical protein
MNFIKNFFTKPKKTRTRLDEIDGEINNLEEIVQELMKKTDRIHDSKQKKFHYSQIKKWKNAIEILQNQKVTLENSKKTKQISNLIEDINLEIENYHVPVENFDKSLSTFKLYKNNQERINLKLSEMENNYEKDECVQDSADIEKDKNKTEPPLVLEIDNESLHLPDGIPPKNKNYSITSQKVTKFS